MPTLDVRCLSEQALANAEQVFHDLKHKRMLPFNESDHDPVRHELDLRLLNEVLNITSEDAHDAVRRLRELLCAEPSIHSGKKSKCNLEKEWENSTNKRNFLKFTSCAKLLFVIHYFTQI